MLRFLLIVTTLVIGQKSYAELSFKPYGKISVDAVKNSAGTLDRTSGNSTNSVNSINEKNHTMHIQNSILGMTGESDLRSLNVSGKIEVDFNGENDATSSEIDAEPRVLEMYTMLNHKGSDVNLLLGQSNDIVAPLNPMTYDNNKLATQGNLGWYRPQARLSREFFNHVDLAISAGYLHNDREDRAEKFDYSGRIGLDTKDMLDDADLKIKLGAGYIDGRDTRSHSVHGQRVSYAIHLLAYDFHLNWNDMFMISSELWEGNGAGHYNGIGTFNTTTNTIPSSEGWWVEGRLKFSKLSLGVGKGEEKADDKAQKATATRNLELLLEGSRTWTNLTYDFNSQVSTGFEYAIVSSTWAENKNVSKDTERYNLNVSYKF